MNIYDLLEKSPTKLNYNFTDYLLNYGHSKHYTKGQTVIEEGGDSKTVFIVLEGVAAIIKSDREGNQSVIATAERGAILGEMGVFLNLKRTATIVAESNLRVLELTNRKFVNALLSFPDLSIRLFKSLSSKISQINERFMTMINRRVTLVVGLNILEHTDPDGSVPVSLNLPQLAEQTGVDLYSLQHVLENFLRLNILSSLDIEDPRQVSLIANDKLLRSYLRSVVSSPIETGP